MLRAFTQAFRTPDLRKKLLFTLGVIAIFRLGSAVPAPGVDYGNIRACLEGTENTGIIGVINLFSGGALLQLSIFALGIMPYITASIIVQLLVVVIPRFEELKKQGQAGQAKLTQYTRYLTIALAILQSTTIVALARSGQLFAQANLNCPEPPIPDGSASVILTMVISMTAGTAVIMWLGELITERGVGNGMSLLIFAGIISRGPVQVWQIVQQNAAAAAALGVVGLLVITFVVFVEQSQRRIPVQYAKRMVGRKMYGGTSTYLPMKVNQAGVIPVIFASSLLYVPSLLVNLWADSTNPVILWITRNLVPTTGDPQPLWLVLYAALIIFFAYFYVAITFDPKDVSDNMKKYGGFVPGIRPGKPTEEYLAYVLSRLTFPGSLYLAAIALVPFIAAVLLPINLPTGDFLLGGTALLIVVGVGLDTVKQIDSQLMLRNYEGFLR